MFAEQILLGSAAILVTITGHAIGLVMLATFLKRVALRISSAIITLVIAIIGIVFIHTIEAWAWAYMFYLLGEFQDFQTALYFSAVTATTLGFGDVLLSENWQILGSFEAMAGLLLFGASTAFLLATMRHLFDDFGPPEDGGR